MQGNTSTKVLPEKNSENMTVLQCDCVAMQVCHSVVSFKVYYWLLV